MEAAPTKSDEIEFRPFSMDDIPCIRSNWANSFYKGLQHHKLVPPQEFHSSHRQIIDRFFMRPTATIIVCCEKKDPNFILGWIALEVLPTITLVHYIYVKHSFKREFKLATQLLLKLPVEKPFIATHMTEKSIKIMAKNHEKFSGWNYIPHLA